MLGFLGFWLMRLRMGLVAYGFLFLVNIIVAVAGQVSTPQSAPAEAGSQIIVIDAQ